MSKHQYAVQQTIKMIKLGQEVISSSNIVFPFIENNSLRFGYGLKSLANFQQTTSNSQTRQQLNQALAEILGEKNKSVAYVRDASGNGELFSKKYISIISTKLDKILDNLRDSF